MCVPSAKQHWISILATIDATGSYFLFTKLNQFQVQKVFYFFIYIDSYRMDVLLQSKTKPVSTISVYSYIPPRRTEPKERTYYNSDSKVWVVATCQLTLANGQLTYLAKIASQKTYISLSQSLSFSVCPSHSFLFLVLTPLSLSPALFSPSQHN